MTFAIVKNSSGDEYIVPNTANNAAGTEYTLSNDVNDSDGNPFTIFTTEVSGVVPKVVFIALINCNVNIYSFFIEFINAVFNNFSISVS